MMQALRQTDSLPAAISNPLAPRKKPARSRRAAAVGLAALAAVTGLGLLTVTLQVKVDESFYRADRLKRDNLVLQGRIEALENQVSRQKSFANIAAARQEFNIQLAPPGEVFYLNLQKANSPTRVASIRY